MRLNRGTLILIGAALAVIVLVIVLTNNQQDAALTETPTPQPTVATGPLFPGVSSENVVGVEVQNLAVGEFVRLVRDTGGQTDGSGVWSIAGTYSTLAQAAQDQVNANVGTLLGLEATDAFESDQLTDFGLDQPAYALVVTSRAGGRYALYIGDQNPSGNRYYAVAVPLDTTTPLGEPTDEVGTTGLTLEPVTGSTAQPATTADATSEATTDAEATAITEITGEPDTTGASDRVAVTAEAGATADAASTSDATADAISTADATADAATTAQVTAQVTAEATADSTADPLPTLSLLTAPRPTLSGTQNIVLLTDTTLDTLFALINTPPYVISTPTLPPTRTPNPLSEVQQTQTATAFFATQAANAAGTIAAATLTAQAAVTADVTAEATAAP